MPFLLIAAALPAVGDELQLALLLRAQADYDRVRLAAPQRLEDTARCVQSQAALLPVAPPAEAAAARYRKGYCLLAGAVVTRAPASFRDAAAELEAASPVLAAIARLEADPDDVAAAAALDRPACVSDVVPEPFCAEVAVIARHWKGWLAARQRRWGEAQRDFAGQPAGWAAWVDAGAAFEGGRFPEAAAAYGRAVDAWKANEKVPLLALPRGLDPPGDAGLALREQGAAQLAAGDAAASLPTLDHAVRRRPSDPRAIALRARAHELAGHADAAIADYNLASRAAFAQAGAESAADAHFYRGIWLYRRKQYEGAENEFTRALNQRVDAALKADVEAWRYLAAVAQHACGQSVQNLEQSARAATPFFPRDEVPAAVSACKP